MGWFQTDICLMAQGRGFHLITAEVVQQVPQLKRYRVGLCHLFLQHTSAALAINENADPSVRVDMGNYFNELVPENIPYLTHTYEGPDDMPAHLKTVLLGHDLTIPIANGRLALGMWQGIYLCEHRDVAHRRRMVVTIQGEMI